MRTNLLLLLSLLALVGCQPKEQKTTEVAPINSQEITLEDLPPITNVNDANQALNKLEQLTVGPFEKLRKREPLTAAETIDLELADKVVTRVVEYDPVNPGYASIQAKTKMALGQWDEAEKILSNALINQPSVLDDVTATIYADLHADLSRVYFEKQEYLAANDEIHKARTVFPLDPWYMTDQASILIEIANREVSQVLYDKAKELCQKALEYDPGHTHAKELLKFLENVNVEDASPAGDS